MKWTTLKIKSISTKGLTKDLINKRGILNRIKYFYSGIFQNYLVSIPAKKYIKYFNGTTQIFLWKSCSNLFAPTFFNHFILPDVNFNGHCLIYNNISIPKKSYKSIYFLHAKSMFKRFKHRFYIK